MTDYQFWLSQGLCPRCHKKKIMPGRHACPECLEKHRKYMANKRKEKKEAKHDY